MKKILAISIFISVAGLAALPVVALADNDAELPDVTPFAAIAKITNIVFNLLLALAVLMFIIGGIMFITAGGSAEQTTKARSILMYGVVGLIVALLAKGVVTFLQSTFPA